MRSHCYDMRLTGAEAVVLFELLRRLQQSDASSLLDAAERRVTESLLGLLEGALEERIDLGYADMVARAKLRLVGTAR